jgi:hypothetical protein
VSGAHYRTGPTLPDAYLRFSCPVVRNGFVEYTPT